MPAAADVLATLHLIVQIGFVLVTLLLLLVTVTNRVRVRHVLLSWCTGRFLGLPAWPTVFLGVVLLFFGGAVAVGEPLSWSLAAGYFVGGVFWLVASMLSSSVLVTEYGVIYHANRVGHAVAWEQMVDYFETPAARRHRYVFFYLDACDTRRRLELTVPRAQHASFRRIIAERLDARFELSMQQVYGKKALEG